MKSIQKLFKAWYVVLAFFVLLIGCASIMTGTKQKIQISSSPKSAGVKIERSVAKAKLATVWEGTTPATVELKRKYEYLATITLDGYEPVEMALEHGTNGWVWGNILIGGLIGLIVDLSNGAAKKLKPNEINVDLVSTMGPDEKMHVFAVLQTVNSDGQFNTLPVRLVPVKK